VHRLRFIHQARGLGFSLKDVAALQELYHDRASQEVKRLALRHVADLAAKIDQMMAMRKALADRCYGDDRSESPILDELASGGELVTASTRDEKIPRRSPGR
jgi:MerR family copper efflux transcriptional regulator